MPAIEWNERFEVGIKEFDNQHKHLFELLNKLYDYFTNGASKEEIGIILDDLADYATHHFSSEEAWMRDNYYPNLDKQRDEHALFVKRVSELLQDYHNGKTDLIPDILALVNSWLTKHILDSDADYGRYYASPDYEGQKSGKSDSHTAIGKFIKKLNLPFHLHISTLLLLLLLTVGGLIGGFGYKMSSDILGVTATDLTNRISRETLGELQATMAPAEMAVNLLSHSPLTDFKTEKERMQQIRLMREVLNNSATLSSVYFGYATGDFFFVRRIHDNAERQMFKAPEGTGYIVQSIERGTSPSAKPRGHYIFLDASLGVLRDDDRPDYPASYDPRSRGWYKDAMAANRQIKTPPYLFFSNRKVGTTMATKGHNGQTVVGADILLETLAASLAKQKVTPGTQIALVNPQGFVIAHEDVTRLVTVPEGKDAKPSLKQLADFGIPVLAQMGDAIKNMSSGNSLNKQIKLEGDDWRVSVNPLLLEGSQPLYLLIAIPDRELLAAAAKLRTTTILITILIILIAIPLTWFFARAISKPLIVLAREGDAIQHFDFSEKARVRSVIKEVNELVETMDSMKRTIRSFLDISQAVAREENFDRLLPMLLTETLFAADADAGVLYLIDNNRLIPAALKRKDGIKLTVSLPQLPLDSAGSLLTAALRDGKPQAGELHSSDVDAAGLAGIATMVDAHYGLAVPLLNRHKQLLGAIMLIRQTPTEDEQISFVAALSSSAASSLETRELIKAQKELFEAFIQLIAGAIDAKSPYTGGHCTRVPELTKMLAKAACDDKTKMFEGFSLTDQEVEAVHIASWLHDCGKIITPEYVVDKSTKLETIYDRIHEVRTRFEVLKRDAEIAYLKSLAGGEDKSAASNRLAAELEQLDSDFAFIASCNEGGEFMAPEKLERLNKIASRSWLRTLDDRIGISHEEKERKSQSSAPTLPVVEPLLANKPEHLFSRSKKDQMPQDNKWGFRMTPPELLYNKGEIYNLSVARGTLSEEERYKINEHTIQTFIMLSELPFPKHLRQVPEIACGHHEKMDGSGYPKGLTKDEIGPVARMMVISDIFEALTAVDRPYKKGKTLTEAIKIMSFMKKDHHIDPDLFDLFLRSGVYLEYARKFMKPEQIDEVNIKEYLVQ